MCGHERIGAKIVACVTACRVDSCSWLFHVATYLASGLPKNEKPTRPWMFLGGGGQKRSLQPCGRSFFRYFRAQTFHSICVKNDRTNRCCAVPPARARNSRRIRNFCDNSAPENTRLWAIRIREIDKGCGGRLPSFVPLRSTTSHSGESFWPMSR